MQSSRSEAKRAAATWRDRLKQWRDTRYQIKLITTRTAVLLGGILAPTDLVLASDVQVEDAGDRDRMRFSLSGEGGLNNGVAFPFVMLGLGLLGLHELGAWGWKWLIVDVIWGICGGLAIGSTLGYLLAKLVIYLRVHHREALGLR